MGLKVVIEVTVLKVYLVAKNILGSETLNRPGKLNAFFLKSFRSTDGLTILFQSGK